MNSDEFLIKIKERFNPIISSIKDLSTYDHYWGYSSISKYKKKEKKIDQYLKLILKFNYSDFKKEDFSHIKMSGNDIISLDYECFFILVYEDKGKIINVRGIGFEPPSFESYLLTLLPEDEDPEDKYGFCDF